MNINKKTAEIIVHIEDDKLFRNSAKEIINSLGYHYSSFENGKEALTYFLNHKGNTALLDRIVCIICDYRMPIMNGEEFISAFKPMMYNIPIIGNSSMYNSQLYLAGADDCIREKIYTKDHGEILQQIIQDFKDKL